MQYFIAVRQLKVEAEANAKNSWPGVKIVVNATRHFGVDALVFSNGKYILDVGSNP